MLNLIGEIICHSFFFPLKWLKPSESYQLRNKYTEVQEEEIWETQMRWWFPRILRCLGEHTLCLFLFPLSSDFPTPTHLKFLNLKFWQRQQCRRSTSEAIFAGFFFSFGNKDIHTTPQVNLSLCNFNHVNFPCTQESWKSDKY